MQRLSLLFLSSKAMVLRRGLPAGIGLIVLSFLLLVNAAPAGQDRFTYRVRGRAIDEHGQPVAKAYIVVDIGPPTLWEDVSYFVESDKAGQFLFYEPEKTANQAPTRLLYLVGPVPERAYSPIMPPFNRLPRLTEKRFAGQRIVIKKNGEVDVGDVPIQLRYGVVVLRLQDRNGNPLITSARAWPYVLLRIRNERRKTVAEGGFSPNDTEKAVNVSESTANVALPEGTWYLEASLFEYKGPWLISKKPVTVKSNEPVSLTLTLRSPPRSQPRLR